MIPIFGLLETPAELKIKLSCTVSCSALNCTVVQWWTLHGSSVLYCTTLYCTIQFCNALYCIIMYWSLMQSIVLSVLLQKGVVVSMCNGLKLTWCVDVPLAFWLTLCFCVLCFPQYIYPLSTYIHCPHILSLLRLSVLPHRSELLVSTEEHGLLCVSRGLVCTTRNH